MIMRLLLGVEAELHEGTPNSFTAVCRPTGDVKTVSGKEVPKRKGWRPKPPWGVVLEASSTVLAALAAEAAAAAGTAVPAAAPAAVAATAGASAVAAAAPAAELPLGALVLRRADVRRGAHFADRRRALRERAVLPDVQADVPADDAHIPVVHLEHVPALDLV